VFNLLTLLSPERALLPCLNFAEDLADVRVGLPTDAGVDGTCATPSMGNVAASRYARVVANPVDSLAEAVLALKHDPTRPVRAQVDDLTVEIRAVATASAPPRNAGDAFRRARWQGEESLDELLDFFGRARREGGSRHVADL
jgi:hypothetical protein